MSRFTHQWSIRRLAAGLFPVILTGILIGCGTEPKPAPVAHNTLAPEKPKPTGTVTTQPTGDAKPEPASATPHSRDEALDGRKLSNSPSEVRETLAVPAGAVPLPPTVPVRVVSGKAVPKPAPGPVAPGMPHPTAGEVTAATPTTPVIRKLQELKKSEADGLTEGPETKLDGKAIGGDEKEAAKGQLAQAQPPAIDPSSAEQYNMYRENEYRSPLVAPLSTFSADVNTASFSNVRRYLSQGQLPPKDAVFLAEFINYFPYDYAKPKGDDPIAYNLELGPCPWNRKHHLLRVGVQSLTMDPKEMPARRFTFLIDTSGSMSDPNKLPLVKQSMNLLVDQLTDKDTVAIVTYAGQERVALMPTPGSEKEKIRGIIENFNAGGSTNGEGGLKKAYELARASFQHNAVNRVILCTDGDFNVGVSNQGDLVRMIEDQRKSGVFLTILGFGMGNYKDGTLKELANHGNGHHAYIDSIDEAKKVFVEQGGALVLVAKDVKFQVDFNPARVAAYRLVGYENRLLKDEDFKNDAKDAGDMGSGHQVTVLYEIVPVGVDIQLPGVDKSKYQIPTKVDPNAPDEWLTVKMRYKQPDAETSKELSQPLKGDAKVKDLSDDFRFAAASASFGMLLRDSEYKGGMTYAGVLEEAQGALGADANGHRKAFLEMVKQAQGIAKPADPAANSGPGSN